ncbi:MAG: hypothetical protein RJB66_1680 [Pseudomonadota bacterium]
MFISTHHPQETPIKGGGVALTQANHRLLAEHFELVTIASLSNWSFSFPGKIWRLILAFGGYWGGNSPTFEGNIQRLIKSEAFELVFVDHSVLGHLAETIKKTSKFLPIITQFHNVESDYYGQIIKNPLLRWITSHAVKTNELAAFQYADEIITLTVNDKERLIELYGERTVHIIPLGLATPKKEKREADSKSANNLLFCGSYFEPNKEALKWFVKNVLDHIENDLIVIGFGMEKLSPTLQHPRLKIVGTVDSTSTYYDNALAVVSPIWSGSGMNAKAIEAIAHGKTLLATPFGLRGLEQPWPPNILQCRDASGFIEKIKTLGNDRTLFWPESIGYFDANFSNQARTEKFKALFKKMLLFNQLP